MRPRSRTSRQLYLASNSPRRKELLSLTGMDYALLSAEVDETPYPGEGGADYVRRVANSKALAASQMPGVDGLIIAADTAVVNGHRRDRAEILGKPATNQAAVEMLLSLRGHTHQVFTALAILPSPGKAILSDLCTTDVPMRDYSVEEVEGYVAGGDPMDKAGAYAIQHLGFHPVEHMQGCFANVMGLPLCHLVRSLGSLGVSPPVDVPTACQDALNYDCPVYRQILAEKNPGLPAS